MGNGNSRPSPRPPPPPPFPPPLPPAPYTHQLLESGATCKDTAVGVGFDAAGCMQQAAAANGPYYCFALAPAIGACYVCEACESSSLIGHSFYRWFDIYLPLPPPTPVPPAPLESRLFAPGTLCTDRFDLAEHGGASGFDEHRAALMPRSTRFTPPRMRASRSMQLPARATYARTAHRLCPMSLAMRCTVQRGTTRRPHLRRLHHRRRHRLRHRHRRRRPCRLSRLPHSSRAYSPPTRCAPTGLTSPSTVAPRDLTSRAALMPRSPRFTPPRMRASRSMQLPARATCARTAHRLCPMSLAMRCTVQHGTTRRPHLRRPHHLHQRPPRHSDRQPYRRRPCRQRRTHSCCLEVVLPVHVQR